MNIKWLHFVPFTILKVVHFRCLFCCLILYKNKTFDDWKLTCFLFLGVEQKDSSDVPKAKRGRKKKVGSCIIWSALLTWFWMEINSWRWVIYLFILKSDVTFSFLFLSQTDNEQQTEKDDAPGSPASHSGSPQWFSFVLTMDGWRCAVNTHQTRYSRHL